MLPCEHSERFFWVCVPLTIQAGSHFTRFWLKTCWWLFSVWSLRLLLPWFCYPVRSSVRSAASCGHTITFTYTRAFLRVVVSSGQKSSDGLCLVWSLPKWQSPASLSWRKPGTKHMVRRRYHDRKVQHASSATSRTHLSSFLSSYNCAHVHDIFVLEKHTRTIRPNELYATFGGRNSYGHKTARRTATDLRFSSKVSKTRM